MDSGEGAGVVGEVGIFARIITDSHGLESEDCDRVIADGCLSFCNWFFNPWKSVLIRGWFFLRTHLLFSRVAVVHSPPTGACVVARQRLWGNSFVSALG